MKELFDANEKEAHRALRMTHPITITQAELKEFSELERDAKVKQQQWSERKENLLLLLRGGAEVEDGRFDARLITRSAERLAGNLSLFLVWARL